MFAVGTLNKETTCFLVLILLVVEGTRLYQKGKAASWWKLAISAVVLTAVWASLYHFSMHYFSAHPTLAEPYHWKSNLRALLVPWQWPQLPSTFGFLWLPFIFGFRWIRHQGPATLRVAFRFVVPHYVGSGRAVRNQNLL